MIVGKALVGPVSRIAATNSSVKVGRGVLAVVVVGVKKRAANACCVKILSSGVGVGENRGDNTISSCALSVPRTSRGIPKASRETSMTTTGITKLCCRFSIIV